MRFSQRVGQHTSSAAPRHPVSPPSLPLATTPMRFRCIQLWVRGRHKQTLLKIGTSTSQTVIRCSGLGFAICVSRQSRPPSLRLQFTASLFCRVLPHPGAFAAAARATAARGRAPRKRRLYSARKCCRQIKNRRYDLSRRQCASSLLFGCSRASQSPKPNLRPLLRPHRSRPQLHARRRPGPLDPSN